jgi:hypothetical protein
MKFVFAQDLEMTREMSPAPDWMVEHMKKQRIRCSAQECNAASAASSPGSWKTETTRKDLPHGPEVSYGIPFRWSASRILASDMRSVLCSALNSSSHTKRSYHNDSLACDSLLHLPSWTLEAFVKGYSDHTFPDLLHPSLRALLNGRLEVPPSLLDMHKHMMGLPTDGMHGPSSPLWSIMQMPNNSDLLWDGSNAPEWVACSQRNTTCHGKISKADWYSPRRTAVCNNVFGEQVRRGLVNSTSVGLDVCNLNSKTNELCKVWRTLLAKSGK